MGKRKSAKQETKKKAYVLKREFDCPYCNFKNCVEAFLKRQLKIGIIRCRICNVNSEVIINELTEPADIYCEWLDICDRINKEKAQELKIKDTTEKDK